MAGIPTKSEIKALGKQTDEANLEKAKEYAERGKEWIPSESGVLPESTWSNMKRRAKDGKG